MVFGTRYNGNAMVFFAVMDEFQCLFIFCMNCCTTDYMEVPSSLLSGIVLLQYLMKYQGINKLIPSLFFFMKPGFVQK